MYVRLPPANERPLLNDQLAFFETIRTGSIEEINALFRKYKININEVNESGHSPLSIACTYLRSDVVRILLEQDANVNLFYPHYVWSEVTAIEDASFRWQKAAADGNKKQYYEAAKIVKLLWEHQPHTHLHCFCIDNSKMLFMRLIKFLQKKSKTSTITFDLSHRDINDSDLTNFTKIWPAFDRVISKLDLSSNSFSHSGLSNLADALEDNKHLLSLNLSNNKNIGCRSVFLSGFQYIIKALYHNNTLEYLNVKHCPLDQADVNTLLAYLKNRRKDAKLRRIDFDIPNAIFTTLPTADQAIILAMKKRSAFTRIINQCQEQLKKYPCDQNTKSTLLQKSTEYLDQCIDIFLGDEEIDPYLEAVAAGLMKFIDVASKNNARDLMPYFDKVLKIIELARTSSVFKINPTYDNAKDNAIDVFSAVFKNNMDALFTAAWSIDSELIKCQLITPTEKIMKVAENILLGLSGLSKVVEGSGQLFKLAGEHLKTTVIECAEMVSKATDIIDIATKIHLGDIKETIVRKIHGLTVKDKCKNLIICFNGLTTAFSKIKAITHAITHHYEDGIRGLSLKEAAVVAKYAFLHISGLLMSGVISKRLTADESTEETILYLSYVSIRDAVVRDDMLTKAEKEFATEFFMRPKLKFCLKEKVTGDFYFCSSHPEQNTNFPARFATQSEIVALNDLLVMLKVDDTFHQAISTPTLIQHQLTFNQQDLLALKNHEPFQTKLSPYKSEHKEIAFLRSQINFLMDNRILEVNNQSNSSANSSSVLQIYSRKQ